MTVRATTNINLDKANGIGSQFRITIHLCRRYYLYSSVNWQNSLPKNELKKAEGGVTSGPRRDPDEMTGSRESRRKPTRQNQKMVRNRG